MTLSNDINAALLAMLREQCGIPEAVRVTGFEQFEFKGGACQTCYWTEIRVGIDYVTGDDEFERYEYHGDMAKLIRTLTGET